MFLELTGHGRTPRTLSENYHHSASTFGLAFHLVVNLLCQLHEKYVQMKPASYSKEALDGTNVWPYMEGCIGAIDGTYLLLQSPAKQQPRWRNRKGFIPQNVLACCDFDMNFTFIFAGMEGSAHDCRILHKATEDAKFMDKIPPGCFLLADAGYPASNPKLLTPYQCTRYHLKEFTNRGPETPRELFNKRHATKRNVIERTFGVFKNRFAIYRRLHVKLAISLQVKLAYALTCLHNMINAYGQAEHLLDEAQRAEVSVPEEDNDDEEDAEEDDDEVLQDQAEGIDRDAIAQAMWTDYLEKLRQRQQGQCMN
ncbi:Transposase, IS4-like protein [Ascosphaera apis ARSEF 7405]|uniref:Transposase, IS4-like protein n=1 Tax=Ascosphaera apis ARSEF 7405 TaxID=392613 RepID=A0A168A8G7_9EURO|nr:Transposase, IS4-like protein [Ascosphaera apis ARSEF 7405]